jgi:hypothetical protein
MPLTRARYDGHAEWYDNWNRPNAERNASDLAELLGPGDGLCLDPGCGSGSYLLNAFIRTGLVIEHVAEHGDRPVPTILAIRARRLTAQVTASGAGPARPVA